MEVVNTEGLEGPMMCEEIEERRSRAVEEGEAEEFECKFAILSDTK